jgi:hypothetical protein
LLTAVQRRTEDEYWSNYEEFRGMQIPQTSCLWKLKMELLVV